MADEIITPQVSFTSPNRGLYRQANTPTLTVKDTSNIQFTLLPYATNKAANYGDSIFGNNSSADPFRSAELQHRITYRYTLEINNPSAQLADDIINDRAYITTDHPSWLVTGPKIDRISSTSSGGVVTKITAQGYFYIHNDGNPNDKSYIRLGMTNANRDYLIYDNNYDYLTLRANQVRLKKGVNSRLKMFLVGGGASGGRTYPPTDPIQYGTNGGSPTLTLYPLSGGGPTATVTAYGGTRGDSAGGTAGVGYGAPGTNGGWNDYMDALSQILDQNGSNPFMVNSSGTPPDGVTGGRTDSYWSDGKGGDAYKPSDLSQVPGGGGAGAMVTVEGLLKPSINVDYIVEFSGDCIKGIELRTVGGSWNPNSGRFTIEIKDDINTRTGSILSADLLFTEAETY